jgi:hypothetical protein
MSTPKTSSAHLYLKLFVNEFIWMATPSHTQEIKIWNLIFECFWDSSYFRYQPKNTDQFVMYYLIYKHQLILSPAKFFFTKINAI